MVKHTVKLTPNYLEVNGKRVAEAVAGESFLTKLYRMYNIEYPKFFKMDVLCKVGFVASEVLLGTEGGERFVPRSDRAVLLFNRHSSLHADNTFQRTIANPDEFYPSPSELAVTKTDPGFAGNTATNTLKPATLETGAEIKVPLFINEGDVLKIDTRTGEYLSRA